MDVDGVQVKQEPPDYDENLDYVLPDNEALPSVDPMETPAVKVEIDEEMHDMPVEEMHEVTVEEVVKEEAAEVEQQKVEAVKVKEEPRDFEDVMVKEEPQDEPENHVPEPAIQATTLPVPAVSIPRAAASIPSAAVLPTNCRMVLVPARVVNQVQPQNNIVAAPGNVVTTPITLPVGQPTVRVLLPPEHRNGVVPTQVVQPMVQQNGVASAAQDVPWSQLWIQPTGTTTVTPAAEPEKGPPRKKTKIEYSAATANAVYTVMSTNTKGGKTRRDVQTQFPTWEFVEERSSGTQTCIASQGVSECGIQTSGRDEGTTLVSSATGTTGPWPPKTEGAEQPSSPKSAASKTGPKKNAGAKKK